MSDAYDSNSFSKSSKWTDFSAVQFLRLARYVGTSGEDALLEFWTGADAETAPCLSPRLWPIRTLELELGELIFLDN